MNLKESIKCILTESPGEESEKNVPSDTLILKAFNIFLSKGGRKELRDNEESINKVTITSKPATSANTSIGGPDVKKIVDRSQLNHDGKYPLTWAMPIGLDGKENEDANLKKAYRKKSSWALNIAYDFEQQKFYIYPVWVEGPNSKKAGTLNDIESNIAKAVIANFHLLRIEKPSLSDFTSGAGLELDNGTTLPTVKVKDGQFILFNKSLVAKKPKIEGNDVLSGEFIGGNWISTYLPDGSVLAYIPF